METKKVKSLSEEELKNVLGGINAPVEDPQHTSCSAGTDDKDCISELASGNGTTDTN